MSAAATDVIPLVQQCIRNACVNDERPESGQEVRSADLLRGYLEGPGLDLQTYEPIAGRTSLVARIEGTDPSAPSLLLMGHTDVVPVNPAGWSRDPHGGELVDGEIWGRGALDMLHLTCSMAVATRRLADQGWRPRGTLVYLAVADEEAMGTWGAEWLVEHALDDVRADYVITESGGIVRRGQDGAPRISVSPAEKGPHWCSILVPGTPGHGSMPYATDNALVRAAVVVGRIAAYHPPTRVDEYWRRTVDGLGLPEEERAWLLDPDTLDASLSALPPGVAKWAHACTHTTFSPNMISGGTKINVIPDSVEVQVDIRTLPGDGEAEVRAMLAEALGELYNAVRIEFRCVEGATASPMDTPAWAAMERAAARAYPGATLAPSMMVGATDARFFRRAGMTAYGFGLYSDALDLEKYRNMFHGNDERIDTRSLLLATQLWEDLGVDLLG